MKTSAKKNIKMDIYRLNESYNRILIWFFSYPQTWISLSELAKETNVSKTTATQIVTQLRDEGFLFVEVIGKSWRISCNVDEPYYRAKKILYNLGMITDLKYKTDLYSYIPNFVQNPLSIILFGSYRRGDDNEKSDIDIAIETLGDADVKIIEGAQLATFGYRNNIKVNFLIFSRKNIDKNLFSNIANGIVLDGFLEVNS